MYVTQTRHEDVPGYQTRVARKKPAGRSYHFREMGSGWPGHGHVISRTRPYLDADTRPWDAQTLY